MRHTTFILILCLLVSCEAANTKVSKERRWIFLNIEVFKASFNDVKSLVANSKEAGANGIVFVEERFNFWWEKSFASEFRTIVTRIRNEVKKQSMDFILLGDSVTYCFGPLSANKNFAAGYPMQNVPMKVACGGSCLEAEQTASIPNGSFESSNGDSANNWQQQGPGKVTFIDKKVKKSGSQSIRTEADVETNSLFYTTVKVRKFQPYLLSFWVRGMALSTQYIAVEIRDAKTEVLLTQQQISLEAEDGSRIYFHGTSEETFEWTQMRIAFNSLTVAEVDIIFGVWKGTSGSAWWDDITLTTVPTLNVLRRKSLPFSLTARGGGGSRKLAEGKDFKQVVDPKLGSSPYEDLYSTYHDPPKISLQPAAGLKVGDSVTLSGYHALPSLNGRVGCSWSDKDQLARIVTTYRRNMDAFKPDGFILDHDEVLHGGWEPAERKKKTAGRAFAAYLKSEVKALSRALPSTTPLFIWSELLDPFNAAHTCNCIPFNKSFKRAFKGADSSRLTIVNTDKLYDYAVDGFERTKKSYAFFARKNFQQVVAGFNDGDVVVNHRNWQDIIGDRSSAGSMYFTKWPGDYSKINEFGQLWWS